MNVRLSNVSFAYPGRAAQRREVLKGLTLEIHAGQCVGVIGSEGAGKSTLLFVLGFLLQPDRGQIHADSVDVWNQKKGPSTVRRRIGVMFQLPEREFFCETVAEELLFGPRSFGDPLADPEVRCRSALALAGFHDDSILDRSPFSLSIGESRRLALALALMMEPELILLDEPTAGLDASATDELLKVIGAASARGATVVAASHDMDFLVECTNRVIVLEDGMCVHDANAAEFFTDKAIMQRFGCSVPEIVDCADRLISAGATLPRRLLKRHELLDLSQQLASP